MALFSKHSLALQTVYSDVKQRALEQAFVLVGTPGSVSEREVQGRPYLYRQFYSPLGKKLSDYIGPADDEEAIARARAVREAIEQANGLLSDVRLLARQGYVRIETRANAILASIANGGLFRAGAVLVGSHAFGVLLNELGIRSAPYATEDIDFARPKRLDVEVSFASLLEKSTVPLSPVLGFDRKLTATSYKMPGRDRLRVDLLSPGREIKPVPLPELGTHAMALPHLDWLLEEPLEAVALGRDSIVPVRVPRPERLALHKLWVSRKRGATSDKKSKDLHQGLVLVAALAEDDAGALADAIHHIPKKMREVVESVAKESIATLERAGHARGAEMLGLVL